MSKDHQQRTQSYARLHKNGLTLPQQNAVDLLAGGKTDSEAAELLNLSRPTVSKWRLYDPEFQAALHRRRAEVWGAAADRLRSLVPKALDTLATILERSQFEGVRCKVAIELLRLTGLSPGAADIGPTEGEKILDALVEARVKATQADRLKHLSDTDRLIESMRSRSKEEHAAEWDAARKELLAEIEAKLSTTDDRPESSP